MNPKFKLLEIKILSLTERKARRIQFDSKFTVITGTNDTGKSSIIKSIVWTLGATPEKMDDIWERANTMWYLSFLLDDVYYAVFRYFNTFLILDKDRNILHKEQGESSVSSVLLGLFKFPLKLITKKNDLITPPTFAYLSPFYIDQDKSWLAPWSNFKGMGMFSGIKDSLARFHTGIRVPKYYEIKLEKIHVENDLESV